MRRKLHRLLVLPVLATLLLALGAVTAFADSVATTSPADGVSYTTAVLHGVASPTSADSFYAFQYGTSVKYGQATKPQPIGSGANQHVSAQLTQLQPGTTYHFRLVVAEGAGYSATGHAGEDLTFTTLGVAPGTVATTGDATSVSTSSATLNGVVNVSDPNSRWAFAYGPTSAYGKVTPVQSIGAGLHAVSVVISGLKPHTRYHFRLFVSQPGPPGSFSAGQDRKLKTKQVPQYGKLSLRRSTLRVSHGTAAIRVRCRGKSGARCTGKLRISVAGRRGNCASASFSVKAGHAPTLSAGLSGSCQALLGKAANHRLAGTLRAHFSGTQRSLKRAVTLSG